MTAHDDIQLHALETIERALGGETATQSEGADLASPSAASGFLVASASGFLVASASGFLVA